MQSGLTAYLKRPLPLVCDGLLRVCLLVALVGGTVASCSDSQPLEVSAGGDGPADPVDLVLLREPADGDLDHVSAGGVLVMDGGCLYLDGPPGGRLVIAWPHGTTWDGDSRSVNRKGGLGPHDDPSFRLGVGERFRGIGTDMTPGQASGFIAPDSQSALDDCLEGGVAVFHAEIRPASLDTDAPPPSSAP